MTLRLPRIVTALTLLAAAGLALAQGPRVPPVPDAVKMARPSAEQVATARAALADFLGSVDGEAKAVFEQYPWLVEVRAPGGFNSALMPNLNVGFLAKHQNNLAVAQAGGDIDVLLMGDSITDFWRNDTGPFAGKPVLDKVFGDLKIANFGIAGDTTQGVLYRLQNGEGKGIKPKAVMLMIGTNNTRANNAPEIAEGIGAVVLELQKDFPEAKILLLGIFPRSTPDDPVRQQLAEINATIARLHDGQKVFYQDIGQVFLDANGVIAHEVMSDLLHPSTQGYELWAAAVNESLRALLR